MIIKPTAVLRAAGAGGAQAAEGTVLSQAWRETEREKEGAGREHRGGRMDSGMTAGLWLPPSTCPSLSPGCPDGTALQEAPRAWGRVSSPQVGYLPGFSTDCQGSSPQGCLDKCLRVSRPAASASPGNLLEMQDLGPTQTY